MRESRAAEWFSTSSWKNGWQTSSTLEANMANTEPLSADTIHATITNPNITGRFRRIEAMNAEAELVLT